MFNMRIVNTNDDKCCRHRVGGTAREPCACRRGGRGVAKRKTPTAVLNPDTIVRPSLPASGIKAPAGGARDGATSRHPEETGKESEGTCEVGDFWDQVSPEDKEGLVGEFMREDDSDGEPTEPAYDGGEVKEEPAAPAAGAEDPVDAEDPADMEDTVEEGWVFVSSAIRVIHDNPGSRYTLPADDSPDDEDDADAGVVEGMAEGEADAGVVEGMAEGEADAGPQRCIRCTCGGLVVVSMRAPDGAPLYVREDAIPRERVQPIGLTCHFGL